MMIKSEKSTLKIQQPQSTESINSIIGLGLHFRQLGMYELALDTFIKAEKKAGSITSLPLLIETLLWQGECLKLLTRYIEAVATFGRILSLYTRYGLRGERALQSIYVVKFTLLEIGLSLIPDSPCDRFIYLESLLVAADDVLLWLKIHNKHHWRSALLLQQASIFEELKKWDHALLTAEEALAVRLEYNESPTYTLSGHLVALANILRQMGRLDEALNVIERTLRERTLSVSDIISTKIAQVNILLSKQGFALTACDKALEAVRLSDDSENIIHRVTTRLVLAKVKATSCQWKDVLEIINQAMTFQRGNTNYIEKMIRRHLRNSLANLSQYSGIDEHSLKHIKQLLVQLGPEEEPWGEKLSYNNTTVEILRWDEKSLITEILSRDKFDHSEIAEIIAEIILAWLSLDNFSQFTSVVFWIVEIYQVSETDQVELISRLKKMMTIKDKDARKCYIMELLEWVTLQSQNKK